MGEGGGEGGGRVESHHVRTRTWKNATPLLLGLLSAVAALRPSPVLASWPSDSLTNVPVCSAPNMQNQPSAASDGAGGAYIAWSDMRGDGVHPRVYVQHLTASGDVAAGWPINGRAIVDGQPQSYPVAVEDGSGGVVVAWYAYVAPYVAGVFAQRLDRNGNLEWGTSGVLVTGTTTTSYPINMDSDGSGGAIFAWSVSTGSSTVPRSDMYAQRVRADGALAWGTNPVHIAAGPDLALNGSPALAPDGSGGAYVAWVFMADQHAPADIRAQHVSAAGAPSWTTNGVPVSTAAGDQRYVVMGPDGAGGAFVAWWSSRLNSQGFESGDLYMGHLTASGVDPSWPTDGLGVETDANQPASAPCAVIPDGAGGAIVSWTDYHVCAQRVNALAVPQWTAGGVHATLVQAQDGATACVSDGHGGVIITIERHYDLRKVDVRAQRVSDHGDILWAPDGVAISCAPDIQNATVAAPDGAGGAILAWHDARSDTGDVYAQDVNADGSLGGSVVAVALSLVSADAGPQGVALEWFTPDASVANAQLERTQDGTQWSVLASLAPDGGGRLRYVDRDVTPGTRYGYRLATRSGTQTDYTATTWVTVPAAYDLALAAPRPNPAVNELSLQFTLPTGTRARVSSSWTLPGASSAL